MNKKVWVFIFWLLLLIYISYSVFISNDSLWVRVLGLFVVILWGMLTPLIDKKKSEQDESIQS
ncbi:hypothetical protein KQ939_00590 [Planococcus sp. CP5-4]|uniref:hypothetical protein n=1 Tax=unclassified Planococcus (in: firmicutes) TaxID=2662419 RepID=UPI001C2259F1|nr:MULTISPECIES: hypothetical protein [unclassified Planococcus (in: firmicutes)]MBU9673364.1 hypothetical protein [Planococcus sp. CP5-4_YE]MBV0908137.1 hypothetical protein [Planococcus sp. CP5-4_UN]MBW6062198.1 hypothetical protein [Planococcus sp. CP5-4]